jgi:polysaccharide export outer membrane protein
MKFRGHVTDFKKNRYLSPNFPKFPPNYQANRNRALKKQELRVRNKAYVLAIGLFLLSGTAMFSQEALPAEYVREFRIGSWDVLEVSVFGEEDYSDIRVQVTEHGRIKLPLLEEVEVLGLTQGELENKLNRLFVEKKLFQNPTVTVLVVERQSQRVSMLGAVANPGRYELLGRQKLLHVVAEAGGFTSFSGEITLIREQQKPLRISIDDLVSGDDRFNIPLQPNDIVYIRPEEIVLIFVGGEVGNPGALEVPKSSMPTLYRAIIQAGGFTGRASKGNVRIKRLSETGEEIIIPVNAKDIEKGDMPDVPLQPGDVIIVGDKIF